MAQAYLSGAYTMAEIGRYLGMHYMTYDGEPDSAKIRGGQRSVKAPQNTVKPEAERGHTCH